MMKTKRPLLRYHGGKWKLADWIVSHLPPHRVYVEPFAGAASVLLKKPRSYAEIYNDLDGEITNLFTITRDRGEELLRAIELTPFSRRDFDISFARSRDPLEQARRTLIRAYMGFGSTVTRATRADLPMRTGFRTNSNRSGTTPARDWRNLPLNLPTIISRLQGVVIENRDAVEVMLRHDCAAAVHYVDPPYVHSTRTADTGRARRGYRYEMTDDEHRKLASVLKALSGSVILSGYPSSLYDSGIVPRLATSAARCARRWIEKANRGALDFPERVDRERIAAGSCRVNAVKRNRSLRRVGKGRGAPLRLVQGIERKYQLDQIIVFTADAQRRERIITWGRTNPLGIQASDFGNSVVKAAGWPTPLCEGEIQAIRRLKRRICELEIACAQIVDGAADPVGIARAAGRFPEES